MPQKQDILLKCENLTLIREGFMLSDICFELPCGYILGVIGRNGSGKSTLVHALLGSCRKEERERVVLGGAAMGEDFVSYKKSLAFVLNETPFPDKLNALDCALLYADYYEGFDKSKYQSLLEEFEVPKRVSVKKLSKGQKIRQQLAFALSYDARLYIFDEPAGNLDAEFRETFWERIQKLTEDGKRSVVYVSHLVEELERTADYILWLGASETEGHKRIGTQKYFGTTEGLIGRFQLIQASREEAGELPDWAVAGIRDRENAKELLACIPREELPENLKKASRHPALKEIMYYVEKNSFADLDGK